MFLQGHGQARPYAIKGKESQRWEYVEEHAGSKRSVKLDLNWVVRAYEDGPCHVEEQQIDRRAV